MEKNPHVSSEDEVISKWSEKHGQILDSNRPSRPLETGHSSIKQPCVAEPVDSNAEITDVGNKFKLPKKLATSAIAITVVIVLMTSIILAVIFVRSLETTHRTLETSSAEKPSSSLKLSLSLYSKQESDMASTLMSHKMGPGSLWESSSSGNDYAKLEQSSSEIKTSLWKQSSLTAETKTSKIDETVIGLELISTGLLSIKSKIDSSTFISGSLIPTQTSSFDSTTNLKSTTTTFLSYSLRPSPTQDTLQLSLSAYSTITRPDVYVRDVVMYQDEGNLTLGCNISNVDDFTRIIFNVNGVEAGKITGDIIDLQPLWTFRNESNSDKQIYLMVLEEANCTHSGNYTCSIGGDWGVVQQTATIQVRTAPGVPVVTIPDEVVEDRLLKQNITCSLDIGIPASMVTWSVEFQDGRKIDNFNFNPTEETNSSKSCTNNHVSSFISTFNISWYNSSLCCNVDQGSKKTSSCKHLFVVPGDYCSNKTNGLHNHPYDDCYQYIQCFNGIIYMNNCNKDGDFCFNKASQSCTQPKATTTMGPTSQASDPYSCDGKITFSYIPVRGSCKDYIRCVHGVQFAGVCTGSSYFFDTEPGQICTNDINQAYCTLHNNK